MNSRPLKTTDNEDNNQSRSVGIVGLGLIGGSIGLDLQELGWEVRGLVHRSKTAKRAKERGLASEISTHPEILAECEIVILALPLDQLIKPDPSILQSIPKSAVITDVGSVKLPILKIWEKLHPRFVASHPMAGSTESGVNSGRKGLFVQRPWVITPNQNTDKQAIQIIQKLAEALGSDLITATPENHDQAAALISHLPVMVSAALLRTIGNETNPTISNLCKQLASSGFEDTTRVGAGNPLLGKAMASFNRKEILKGIKEYKNHLETLEQVILSEEWCKLKLELEKAQALRSNFLEKLDP